MSAFNNWKTLDYTDTMADLVERFNDNSRFGSNTDEVVSKIINTGVIPTGNEKVNGLAIGPHVNLKTMLPGLSNVQFTGFRFYFKSLNQVFSDNMNVDLSSYADGSMHFLYLKPDLTFITLSKPYTGNEDYLYIAKFFATASASINYFFITCPSTGTGAYNCAGMEYQVISGIQPVALEDLALKVTDGVIKYSGIDLASYNTDVLFETFAGTGNNIRYITSGTNFNKVDWSKQPTTKIITNQKMNYSTGELTPVADNKFSCQKVFYDIGTKDLIIQYGGVAYDSMAEAEAGTTNFKYDAPDGDNTYVPIAVIIIKSGTEDLTLSTDFEVVNIAGKSLSDIGSAVDATARATANSALTQAQGAYTLANQASTQGTTATTLATQADSRSLEAISIIGDITTPDTMKYDLNTHVNNTNNPHNVTKAQVGLGNVDNTSDANKPLSTAQKAYVDQEVGKVNTTLAGMPDFNETPQVFVQSSEPTGTQERPLKLGDIWLIPEE